MLNSRIAVLLAVLLALVLTACGGASQPAAPAASSGLEEVVVTVGSQLTFNPATIELTAGQPVRLVLKNEGALEHDLTIDQIGIETDEPAESSHGTGGVHADLHVHAVPGKTAERTFTPETSGTYTFYCTIPGHKEGGMVGSLTVK